MDDDSGSGVDAADSEEFEPVPQQQRPSAKALGKRRVVEPDESDSQFDPDDMFYEHNNDSRHSEPLDDADSDGDGNGLRQKRSVQYVYDAAAEKTRERIREGRLHLAETNATALVAIVH
ncbi:hypothetical protein EUX98_g7214 [Antrodiella citrinella]|uniref:Uncharacterized protein n=1 Tax=Antrodiella citrinella TaxID=2447956 RepID=A0A4S4MM30_9APHY|nr:hypothetical protein EUX98_g7214 [Antrodiella citrinella]